MAHRTRQQGAETERLPTALPAGGDEGLREAAELAAGVAEPGLTGPPSIAVPAEPFGCADAPRHGTPVSRGRLKGLAVRFAGSQPG